MNDLASKQPAETLDVLGRVCPYPIVLIKKEMLRMGSGAILKVLCDTESTAEEVVPRYCEKHGYAFESFKNEDEGHWELYIRKT